MITFTEKERKRILKIKKTNKWMPWLTIFLCLLVIFQVAVKIVFIHRLTNLTGVTTQYVINLAFKGPSINRSYEGFEVVLASWVQEVFIYPIFAVLIIFIAMANFKRNRLLIKCWQMVEELEKEQK